MSKWEPSHPDLAVRPDTPLREADPSGKPWDPAPADSHVREFRFFDAQRDATFLKKFGEAGGASQIHVRFRAKATKKGPGAASEYIFFLSDHAQARDIFADIKAAAHPGEVVAARLFNKVPYRREV